MPLISLFITLIHNILFSQFSQHASVITTLHKEDYIVMLCSIWYHFYNIKHVKKTRGGVLL